MKILYLSCHSILEHDEIKMFTQLGHQVFSPNGAYMNPNSPGDIKRPSIANGYYNDHLVAVSLQYSKENLHQELIDWADVIIVMHKPEWIIGNWQKMAKKKVIWRSIGQSSPVDENSLALPRAQGMKIVRYSPAEEGIPGYLGADAIIRFGKDSNEFKDWNGEKPMVVTVAQGMKNRGEHCNYQFFMDTTVGFPRTIFGPENEDSGISGGLLSYEELKGVYRNYRTYFYTGTYPASYTLNFIEAFMTGIPIVAIGPSTADIGTFSNMHTYEVNQIIKHGVNGFCSDDREELRGNLDYLLAHPDKAREIGQSGRATAIELFDEAKIQSQWSKFLNSL